MNFRAMVESKFEVSEPVVIGNRDVVVASRRTSFGFSPGPVHALQVQPEYIFVREAGYIYGMSVTRGTKVDLEKIAPDLRQSVLDSFSKQAP